MQTAERKHPDRERVFFASLQYYGFTLSFIRVNLDFGHGYIMPATIREDSGGIDCYVKMPRDHRIFPVQVTQRGIRINRKLKNFTENDKESFLQKCEERIRAKQAICARSGIVFILLRDYLGKDTNPALAQRDVNSLCYGIEQNKRR